MSEDAHFSGDEPLFAHSSERGPGFTIYTCPRCGGERRDGMKCLKCEQSTYPSSRYAFQGFDWDPSTCPRCGFFHCFGEEECPRCHLAGELWLLFIKDRGEHRNIRIDSVSINRYVIPLHQVRFHEAMTGKRELRQPVPSAPEHAWLSGMRITWNGDSRDVKVSA